jgi:cytochrome c oxidase subunit 3
MATLTKIPGETGVGSPPPIIPDTPRGGGGGPDDHRRREQQRSSSASYIGICIGMAASVMTFASFVSAMVVRRGLNSMDWHKPPLPGVLYWNTVLLLLSSIALDWARRVIKKNRRPLFNALWTAGLGLGLWFLIGQIIAWRQLEKTGFYLAGNPASAFFYVLTWAHAAHVVGALAAVAYVEYRALRFELNNERRNWIGVTALFWHFLDVMWLAIMALFIFWA